MAIELKDKTEASGTKKFLTKVIIDDIELDELTIEANETKKTVWKKPYSLLAVNGMMYTDESIPCFPTGSLSYGNVKVLCADDSSTNGSCNASDMIGVNGNDWSTNDFYHSAFKYGHATYVCINDILLFSKSAAKDACPSRPHHYLNEDYHVITDDKDGTKYYYTVAGKPQYLMRRLITNTYLAEDIIVYWPSVNAKMYIKCTDEEEWNRRYSYSVYFINSTNDDITIDMTYRFGTTSTSQAPLQLSEVGYANSTTVILSFDIDNPRDQEAGLYIEDIRLLGGSGDDSFDCRYQSDRKQVNSSGKKVNSEYRAKTYRGYSKEPRNMQLDLPTRKGTLSNSLYFENLGPQPDPSS